MLQFRMETIPVWARKFSIITLVFSWPAVSSARKMCQRWRNLFIIRSQVCRIHSANTITIVLYRRDERPTSAYPYCVSWTAFCAIGNNHLYGIHGSRINPVCAAIHSGNSQWRIFPFNGWKHLLFCVSSLVVSRVRAETHKFFGAQTLSRGTRIYFLVFSAKDRVKESFNFVGCPGGILSALLGCFCYKRRQTNAWTLHGGNRIILSLLCFLFGNVVAGARDTVFRTNVSISTCIQAYTFIQTDMPTVACTQTYLRARIHACSNTPSPDTPRWCSGSVSWVRSSKSSSSAACFSVINFIRMRSWLCLFCGCFIIAIIIYMTSGRMICHSGVVP